MWRRIRRFWRRYKGILYLLLVVALIACGALWCFRELSEASEILQRERKIVEPEAALLQARRDAFAVLAPLIRIGATLLALVALSWAFVLWLFRTETSFVRNIALSRTRLGKAKQLKAAQERNDERDERKKERRRIYIDPKTAMDSDEDVDRLY